MAARFQQIGLKNRTSVDNRRSIAPARRSWICGADASRFRDLVAETIRKALGRGRHFAVNERMPTHHAILQMSRASAGCRTSLRPAFSSKRPALLVVLVSFWIM